MADVAIPSSGGEAVVVGKFTGNGRDSQTITLGFTPSAVLVISNYGEMYYEAVMYGGVAVQGSPCKFRKQNAVEIVTGGFQVTYSGDNRTNAVDEIRHYIAFR